MTEFKKIINELNGDLKVTKVIFEVVGGKIIVDPLIEKVSVEGSREDGLPDKANFIAEGLTEYFFG